MGPKTPARVIQEDVGTGERREFEDVADADVEEEEETVPPPATPAMTRSQAEATEEAARQKRSQSKRQQKEQKEEGATPDWERQNRELNQKLTEFAKLGTQNVKTLQSFVAHKYLLNELFSIPTDFETFYKKWYSARTTDKTGQLEYHGLKPPSYFGNRLFKFLKKRYTGEDWNDAWVC